MATLRPQFVFVEGFLLLADISTSKIEPDLSNTSKRRRSSAAISNIASEKAKITKYLKQLDGLSSELVTKDNIDDLIEGERDVIEAQFWATNLKAKEYLQGLFDVKLFLNTSKGQSKRSHGHDHSHNKRNSGSSNGCLPAAGRARAR